MANLSIRKLDDEIVSRLRMQAKRHHISMEAEIRHILQQAVRTPQRLGDLAVQLFSPAYDGGEELVLPPREISEPIEFS